MRNHRGEICLQKRNGKNIHIRSVRAIFLLKKNDFRQTFKYILYYFLTSFLTFLFPHVQFLSHFPRIVYRPLFFSCFPFFLLRLTNDRRYTQFYPTYNLTLMPMRRWKLASHCVSSKITDLTVDLFNFSLLNTLWNEAGHKNLTQVNVIHLFIFRVTAKVTLDQIKANLYQVICVSKTQLSKSWNKM